MVTGKYSSQISFRKSVISMAKHLAASEWNRQYKALTFLSLLLHIFTKLFASQGFLGFFFVWGGGGGGGGLYHEEFFMANLLVSISLHIIFSWFAPTYMHTFHT